MLKYSDIINQLSADDKIRMLCDISSLSDKKYRVLGIPTITLAAMEEACRQTYPSPLALANTWNPTLVEQVSAAICRELTAQGVDMAMLPGPKMKINPYRPALSEDPYLCATISRELCRAAHRFGLFVALTGYSVSRDELAWMDREPDDRFLSEYFVKSYATVSTGEGGVAVLAATDPEEQHYQAVNTDLTKRLTAACGKDVPFLYKKLSSDETVQHISHGDLCLEGSALALESALARYKQLQKSVEHGHSTMEDLHAEIARGRALSPEMLDEAVDRLLQFAFSVKRKPSVVDYDPSSDLAMQAHSEATVLLKNEGPVLPMKKGLKICILGDLTQAPAFLTALSDSLTGSGHVIIGTERGYDLGSERSEQLLPPALDLAASADLVLLFLGLGKEREKRTAKTGKISIPANQQALLDELCDCARKVIAVLPPECSPDIGFPENCAAILFAPMEGESSAASLAACLTGEREPAGRLACTAYCDTEALYAKHMTHRHRDGLQVGPFIGYRYYDTAKSAPLFPFGHGLGYTKFAYSQLTVENNKATLTVTNTGKRTGSEVVQVYMGIAQSAVLRPEKELCGFCKLTLAPDEKRTVEIPLTIPTVYDAAQKAFIEESGSYTVYVGASVTDIRLQQTITAGNGQVTADGKRRSDYIQTDSNIISDNFKLEAKKKAMKKSIFHYIAGALAILLAIVLKMYCAAANLSTTFFDVFAFLLCLCGIGFFIGEAVHRNRLHKEERAASDALSEESFTGAEQVEVPSADRLFVKEFDTVEEDTTAVPDDRVEGVEAEQLAYVDKEQSFEAAARDFELFAAERGCQFDHATVKSIFASIAASRLLVVYGMGEAEFRRLMLLLTGYFETAVYLDRVDASYTDSESALFKPDGTGNRAKTHLFSAIESARNIKHAVHFAALDNVSAAELTQYFTPYISYVKNPFGNSHVTVTGERGGELSYYIPRNLWLVLNLAKGETPDKLPAFVAEVASCNHFSFSECKTEGQHSPVRKFSYYQLEHLSEKAVSKTSLPEEMWKRIDRIEEQVSRRTPFAMGNKLWLCLEKYAYVYVACGGDAADAIDRAAAAKLMAAALSALAALPRDDERSFGETVETILGEDRAEACKKLIKACEDARA